MKLVKVAAAVLNQTPLDWAANRRNILSAIEQARAQGARILCLPELCISGYGCEDAFHSPFVWRTSWEVLQEIAPATQGMIVSLGLPVLYQNAVFNCGCLAVDGRIVGLVAKKFLAGDGLHYEPRWFKPWPQGVRAELEVAGQRYPLGDLFFDCGGVKLGFEICEDAWVANRPGTALALRGVDIILNPSASHFAFGKFEVRQRFVLEGSRAFGVSYVYANLLGNEAGRAIYDGGALIASSGKLLAAGPRFSYADALVTSAVVDLDNCRMNQARTASFEPDINAGVRDCVRVEFDHAEIEPVVQPLAPAAWETGADLKCEEFARSVSLALFDYLRKSRSRGFVVSLSGGADSAAVACLVALAARFGIADIGRERFLSKLAHVPELATAGDEREIVRRLLTTVYQATRNSSATTRDAARRVAEAVGSEHVEFDVEAIVGKYLEQAARALGRPLAWETDDVALQNIQARVRSPGAWLLANVRNALLLATSNRSEAAVGYATMDGDTSGGLSPIAGIDKAFIRHWLRWLETQGPDGHAPIPALSVVNVQAPTAELRPPSAGQTDEADLMPYELLDAVERFAIRDKHSPREVLRQVRPRFPQYQVRQLAAWIERFFRLFSRNQWKRERYAPSFHVDDESLDPKTWCRFPILSGGFERELAELRAEVEKL